MLLQEDIFIKVPCAHLDHSFKEAEVRNDRRSSIADCMERAVWDELLQTPIPIDKPILQTSPFTGASKSALRVSGAFTPVHCYLLDNDWTVIVLRTTLSDAMSVVKQFGRCK